MRFLYAECIILIFILCFLTCYFVIYGLIKKSKKEQTTGCFGLSDDENINNIF